MNDVTMIVVFSLVASIALVVFAWYRTGDGWSVLKKPVPGSAGWDFSKSWGSNLTILGAILGTTLSSKVFPEKTIVLASASDYISLSLLFAVVVLVAPFVYNAFLVRVDPSGTHDSGRGWAILVACSLTLWGVIGQLGTVGLAFYEAHHTNSLAFGAVIPLWAVLGVALVLIVRYATETIAVVVLAEKKKPKEPAAGAPGFAPAAPAPAAAAGWSLL